MTFQVRIKSTDDWQGVKKGEIYEAEVYRCDPCKITLLGRVPDGYNPECNQYKDEVDILHEPLKLKGT